MFVISRKCLYQILSLTTEFKYSPSQCGKGHVCAIGYVSDQKSSAPEDLLRGHLKTWLGSSVTGWGECVCHLGPRKGHLGLISVSA